MPDATIRIRAGFDGVEFIVALRVCAHVTAQARIAIIVAVGRVVTFFVRMVDVDRSGCQRSDPVCFEDPPSHDQTFAWLLFADDRSFDGASFSAIVGA